MADDEDLKSFEHGSCGFESHQAHIIFLQWRGRVMTEVCKDCEYREQCEQLGFEFNIEDQDECEHYYGFAQENEE